MSEQKFRDVGALWARKSKSGSPYLYIKITIDDKTHVFAGKKIEKVGESKLPDYRIYPWIDKQDRVERPPQDKVKPSAREEVSPVTEESEITL